MFASVFLTAAGMPMSASSDVLICAASVSAMTRYRRYIALLIMRLVRRISTTAIASLSMKVE